jgi:hypothetical protein
MSNEQISDLRVTLARLEERQIQLFSMVETSLANYADVANRLRCAGTPCGLRFWL